MKDLATEVRDLGFTELPDVHKTVQDAVGAPTDQLTPEQVMAAEQAQDEFLADMALWCATNHARAAELAKLHHDPDHPQFGAVTDPTTFTLRSVVQAHYHDMPPMVLLALLTGATTLLAEIGISNTKLREEVTQLRAAGINVGKHDVVVHILNGRMAEEDADPEEAAEMLSTLGAFMRRRASKLPTASKLEGLTEWTAAMRYGLAGIAMVGLIEGDLQRAIGLSTALLVELADALQQLEAHHAG